MNALPSIFEGACQSVDLNVTKTFGSWSIKATVKNISDEEHLFFYDGVNEPLTYESGNSGVGQGAVYIYR